MLNLKTDQRNVGTHDILAPDTAMLKPVCHFPCPFDTPLILGLNFLRISDVKKEGLLRQKRGNTNFVTVQLCHLVVSMCIALQEGHSIETGEACGLLGNVVTVSRVLSPPMLVNEKTDNE